MLKKSGCDIIMAMKKFLTLFFLIFVVAIFGLAQTAVAQDFGSTLSATADVAVEFSPSAPGPNQTVTATASSFSVDLNSSSIAWFVNGKMQKTGTGLANFSFQTGTLSQTTTIDMVVNTIDGQVIKKTFSIKPAEV